MNRKFKLPIVLAIAAMTVLPTAALAAPKKATVTKKVPAIGTVKNGYVWDGDEWDSIYDDDDWDDRYDDDRWDRDDWDDDDDWDDRDDD